MRTLVVLSVIFALSGCKLKFGTPSAPKESPDNANVPQNLGIPEGPFKWSELKGSTSAAIEHPWADTYWPLNRRGLALRWMGYGDREKVTPTPKTLNEAVTQLAAAETGDGSSLAYLSPAEKYDLLLSSTKKITPELWAKLKADEESFKTKVAKILEPLTKQEEDLNAAYGKLEEEYNQLMRKAKDLADQVVKAEAEKNESLVTQLKTELDSYNAKFTEMNKQATEINKKLRQNGFDKRQAAKDYYLSVEGLAKEMEAYLPMTSEGWKVWAGWEASEVENLNWMGHCHGWAAAALVEKKPQRSVLVEKEGKKILFSEGDIRGLLTKLWAEQPPETGGKQGARRCNASAYDVDRRGRILDGSICYDKKEGSCDLKAGGKPFYIKNNGIERGFITFTEELHETAVKVAVVNDSLGSENYSMLVFANMTDFNTYADSDGKTIPSSTKNAVMHVTAGCRDVNPMTLHLALTKLLKEKQIGFVLDVTRSAEVWNQPAYKYELEYLPVTLNKKDPSGKTTQPGGEPALVSDIDDPFKDYRAVGTHSLVVVQAKIYYGMENGPRIDYDQNDVSDDRNEAMKVTYTLEMDRDQNLIGGEWGAVPLPGDANADNKDARMLIGGDAPDFIWYYQKDAKLKDAPYQVSLIQKIHECSLQPASGKMKINEADWEKMANGAPGTKSVEIEYVDCKL